MTTEKLGTRRPGLSNGAAAQRVSSPVSRFSPSELTWRLEVKFTIPTIMLPTVRSRLLLGGFGMRRSYDDRVINNLYFDSETMSAAWANHSGVARRQKVRLRWYDEEERFTLEIKIKRGTAGAKISVPVDCFLDLATRSWTDLAREIRSGVPGEFALILHSQTNPTLINSYRRSYYEIAGGRVRATVDYDIRSADQRGRSRPYLRLNRETGDSAVLELKASVDEEPLLRDVAAGLSLRMSKNSKYIRGLSRRFG